MKAGTEGRAPACWWKEGAERSSEEGCRLKPVCVEGDPSSWAAPGSGFGSLRFYPRFEFAPIQPEQTLDWDAQRAAYFAPYRDLPAEQVRFSRGTHPVLERICREDCPLYPKSPEGSPQGRKPVCTYDFTDSFSAEFEAGDPEEGKGRRREADRCLRVLDLRLLGRPVEITLWYSGRLPQTLREQVGSYPGFESGSARIALRLGRAVDRGLLHNLPEDYLSEASALSPQQIGHWRRTRILEASLALPQLVTRYTLEDSDDYSAWTENRSLRVPDKLHESRMEKYTFTYRREGEQPPRLISIYPASEWNLVRKLAATPLTQLMEKHELNLSPGRLFNLGVDFLSVTLSGGGPADRQVAPALAAMLFLSLCEEERPGCGEELFRRLDQPYSGCYTACYWELLGLYQDTGRAPWSHLPEMLSGLLRREEPPRTELDQRVRDWYDSCARRAADMGVRLVRCLSLRESFWFSRQLEGLTELTEGGGVRSVREFITRLLLFNPATLATVQREHLGSSRSRMQAVGTDGEYLCAFDQDGGFSFTDVVPGILTDELRDLLDQGFLREAQDRYLIKRSDAESWES